MNAARSPRGKGACVTVALTLVNEPFTPIVGRKPIVARGSKVGTLSAQSKVTLEAMAYRLTAELELTLKSLFPLIANTSQSSLELHVKMHNQLPTRRMQVQIRSEGLARVRLLNDRDGVEVVLYYELREDSWVQTEVFFGGDGTPRKATNDVGS